MLANNEKFLELQNEVHKHVKGWRLFCSNADLPVNLSLAVEAIKIIKGQESSLNIFEVQSIFRDNKEYYEQIYGVGDIPANLKLVEELLELVFSIDN